MSSVSDKVRSLRSWYDRETGKRDQIHTAIDRVKAELRQTKKKAMRLEKARIIIQTVAQDTQKQLEYHVSELVSLALEAVFSDPYKLVLDFELKRGRTEARLFFQKEDSEPVNPMFASGGGPKDIASVALRISLWSLQRGEQRTRPVLILDEPLRNLSMDLQPKASKMLQDISKKLGLQMIIVTHKETLVEYADRVFSVKMVDRVSQVTQR